MTDEQRPPRVRTISIDFDGVIHRYSKGWHDGTIYDPPVDGAIEALQAFQRTFAVVIHTTRDADQVVEWLLDHGLNAIADHRGDRVFWNDQETILVSSHKVAALAYIDDRGIRFTDWAQAQRDVEDLL